jgi:hypothetical protein
MNVHRRARRRAGVAAVVRVALLAGGAVALLGARPALAFVRYKTASGIGFFWPQTCVPATVYPLSMTDKNGNMEMTPQQIMTTVTAAATTWGADSNACTYLRINVTSSSAPTPEARYDYKNSIIFRTLSWDPPSDMPGAPPYAPEALAITSVFVDKSNGQIKDGDIEINVFNWSWGDLVADPSLIGTSQDLQNALTHEMGHLIGLDHTCYVAGTVTTIPIDNAGNPVPSCDMASEAVLATTMAATAIPGDTAKRTLAPDDIDGVCDIYPVAMDPMKCPAEDEPPPSTAACAASGAGGRPDARVAGLMTFLMTLTALARRRRRRT